MPLYPKNYVFQLENSKNHVFWHGSLDISLMTLTFKLIQDGIKIDPCTQCTVHLTFQLWECCMADAHADRCKRRDWFYTIDLSCWKEYSRILRGCYEWEMLSHVTDIIATHKSNPSINALCRSILNKPMIINKCKFAVCMIMYILWHARLALP